VLGIHPGSVRITHIRNLQQAQPTATTEHTHTATLSAQQQQQQNMFGAQFLPLSCWGTSHI
jgi:hypothetical protein